MGTRNLTMVIDQKGKTKVAQYGQWDGHPGGVGASILGFLGNKELFESLKNNLSKVRFLDPEGRDKEFFDSYNENAPEWSNQPDNRTEKQKEWHKQFVSRDLADDVLANISKSNDDEIILIDKSNFAKDSLFCEWAYVVDLSKNTFEVYEGFNKSELDESERFFPIQDQGSEYYPVKLLKSFNLDDLPEYDKFLKVESEIEEEDE